MAVSCAKCLCMYLDGKISVVHPRMLLILCHLFVVAMVVPTTVVAGCRLLLLVPHLVSRQPPTVSGSPPCFKGAPVVFPSCPVSLCPISLSIGDGDGKDAGMDGQRVLYAGGKPGIVE